MNKCFWSTLVLFLLMVSPCFSQGPGSWHFYKQTFVSPDGRIIDNYQDKSSHSEGQGYGLLLSVFNKDPKAFESILAWTKNNLMIRNDHLSAWHWGMRTNGQWGIMDYNNATDGDLLIAWALLEADETWQQPEYKTMAMAIISDIKNNLIIKKDNRMLLLPGYYGFDLANALLLNPSYFIYPAFEKFSKNNDPDYWQTLAQSCLDISFNPSYTRLGLPADWLRYQDSVLSIDKDRGRLFGYEAIRIPLYLAMSKKRIPEALFENYLGFFQNNGLLPRVVNLIDSQVSIDEAPAGFYAVFAAFSQATGRQETSKTLKKKADEKIKKEIDDYFSNTLYLLSKTVTDQ